MAGGHGGRRPGAGRPRGSTRRARNLGPVLAAEQSLFLLLPKAEKHLEQAIERGEGWAIQLIFRYALIPAAQRADLVAALERERLSDDDLETDHGEASNG